MNSLRKRIVKVTKFLKENKDLADSFCHHAEKLANDLSKTLQKPRSLSPETVSGLQSLQKTVLDAIFSLTKSFKNALSSHHSEQHPDASVTLVHQNKKPRPQHPARDHSKPSPHVKESMRHRHSFTRTGKN